MYRTSTAPAPSRSTTCARPNVVAGSPATPKFAKAITNARPSGDSTVRAEMPARHASGQAVAPDQTRTSSARAPSNRTVPSRDATARV